MRREPLNVEAVLEPAEQWFARSGWTPFDFQRETWRAYLQGESGLVHAPTGMGKTFAVWLGPLAEALACGEETPAAGLRVLWITPLRALAADTTENLRTAATQLGLHWTIEMRTGDSPQSAKIRQRKTPPAALVTTPESLSVLLSYPGSSEHFRNLRCIIVDEWHELLGTKRGVQTELCLARLRTLSLCPQHLRTWGLSATLGNLDQAMRVLLGAHHQRGRMIRGDMPKTIIVDTLRPADIERFPWSGHVGLKLLNHVIGAIESARTTLLFTNVRSAAEIWFQQILKARPDMIGQIALHHGSLDRDIRNRVEDLLRTGAIRAVVCTSSLDLGVDFSPVDQVMQLGSPKGIARMMQRAGRSGHQPGAPSRILGVPTNALELVEFAAAREAAGAMLPSASGERVVGEGPELTHHSNCTDGSRRAALTPTLSQREREMCPSNGADSAPSATVEVESRQPLDRPLDVLVQHLVTLAAGDGFVDANELRREVQFTHAFANLTDDEWNWAMTFITQGGAALTAYPQYAKVTRINGRHMIADKTIERLHRMSIGTIVSDSAMNVAFLNGSILGTIEESFISRLRPGDRFVFAGKVLELIRVRNLTAYVEKARRISGVVPRWMGGKSPLSNLLANAVRRKLNQAREGVYNSPEMQLVRPLLELQARWSAIPRPDELLIEINQTRDGHHVFVFPLDGRLVHEGLSSLIAHRLTQQRPRSMHVTANDYGFELLSREPIELDERQWRTIFSPTNLVEDLLGCLNTTALARRQFREIARVAGLIFPGFPGAGKSNKQLQASSQLFFDVFTEYDPGNLLLDQARREVLDRELEVRRLRETLERVSAGHIRITRPRWLTPLSFPIWAESIRTQHVSSEKWSDRVKRMVVMLEREAEQSSGTVCELAAESTAKTGERVVRRGHRRTGVARMQ